MGAPEECVFCEIARTGKNANGFIRYGETVVSFIPLKPRVPGHRLFVPVRHALDFGLDPAYGAAAFYFAGVWGAEKNEDFNLITSRGLYATQTVMHTHIHYVPRREGDNLKLPWSESGICLHGGGCLCGHTAVVPCHCRGN